MASRTKQKEEARARRLAEERALAERARQRRRLQMLGGVVLAAIAIVAVAIALSVGGGKSSPPKNLNSQKARNTVSPTNRLLTGIPQSGSTLGPPSAKVTITEYGDLQCPVCKDFAESAEQKLIQNDVRQGKVRLIYKSLATATLNGPNPGVFPTQQAAAYAAGLQNLGWYYILNFYRLQGQEDTNYVNTGYLNGIARLVPGLNFAKWSSDRTSSKLTQQVTAEQNTAKTLGLNSTPTLIVQGPKGQAQPVAGDIPYNSLEQLIQSVS
jgi:protein-disulfide isomerase